MSWRGMPTLGRTRSVSVELQFGRLSAGGGLNESGRRSWTMDFFVPL